MVSRGKTVLLKCSVLLNYWFEIMGEESVTSIHPYDEFYVNLLFDHSIYWPMCTHMGQWDLGLSSWSNEKSLTAISIPFFCFLFVTAWFTLASSLWTYSVPLAWFTICHFNWAICSRRARIWNILRVITADRQSKGGEGKERDWHIVIETHRLNDWDNNSKPINIASYHHNR